MSWSSDENEENMLLTPEEIRNEANIATNSLLPEKSKEKYTIAYENFMTWRNNKNAQSFSENVFLAYFNELAKKYKPSSLWCIYSMLKSTIRAKQNIDIKTYLNLSSFLKQRSSGFRSRKSKVLSSDDVERFLKEAPDSQYLATKVAMIFGIAGACRRQELNNLTTKDVQNHGKMLLVKILNTKNKVPRSFTIDGPFYEIVKKYEGHRSTKGKTDRYFQNFQKGKCTSQPIGINKFGSMPKEVAKFLNLPDAESYTGHSFRRTSATLLADAGADILTLKRHGGWRSNTVAESYVEDSIQNKINIGAKITQSINLETPIKKFCSEPRPSTSNADLIVPSQEQQPEDIDFLSPTFTEYQEENSEIINRFNKTVTNTVKMPTKTVTYNFSNCTFTNCFNN